jgi:hypothetical protein
MSIGRASPATTVELATSREVPFGGDEYRKSSSMYTAPIPRGLADDLRVVQYSSDHG